MLRTIVAASLLLSNFAVTANDVGDARVVAEVKEAIATWVDAFNVRDAQRVAALYAPDAVFWGTVSPTIRITPSKVFEYFESSVTRKPELRVASRNSMFVSMETSRPIPGFMWRVIHDQVRKTW